MPRTPTEHAKEMLRAVMEHPGYLYTWEADGVDRYVFGGSDPYPDFTANGIHEAYDYTLKHQPGTLPVFPDALMVRRLRSREAGSPGPRIVAPVPVPDRVRVREIRVNHPFPWEEEEAADG